jgi:hypothetical protein
VPQGLSNRRHVRGAGIFHSLFDASAPEIPFPNVSSELPLSAIPMQLMKHRGIKATRRRYDPFCSPALSETGILRTLKIATLPVRCMVVRR